MIMSLTQTNITVMVETPIGSYQIAFGPNHHIGAILGEVLARMERDTNLEQYTLVWNQTPLDMTQTLQGAGINDGDTLFLEANPVSI